MRTGAFPNIVQQSDATANDSDKTLTVTTGKAWRLMSITATLAATATVGNRQLDVLITDGSDNELSKLQAGAVITANQTKTVIFAEHNPQETAYTNDVMFRALPAGLILPAGYKIRIYDSAAVDAAADDLTVRMLVEELAE